MQNRTLEVTGEHPVKLQEMTGDFLTGIPGLARTVDLRVQALDNTWRN